MTVSPEVAEVAEVMPVADAQSLDTRIRLMATTVEQNIDKLSDLLREAQAGQIHVALGFDSWTAYVADAVRFKPESIEQRRELVALMFGEGMSERAIAEVVGVSQKTVDRDLENMSRDDSPEPGAQVIGLDGKSYTRKPKGERKRQPKAKQPLNVEVSKAVAALTKNAETLSKLCGDCRFVKNVYSLTRHRSELARAINSLQAIVDKFDTAEAGK